MGTNGGERVDTLIIGGGQAGLATGYHLARLGRPFLVLDSHNRVGDNWRRHWASLRLYSPTRYDSLPGLDFPGDPWGYPSKDEVADYLEGYAARFDLPVRGGVTVDRLERDGDGYLVHAGERRFTAANVVVATGTFGRPYVPECAAELDPAIRQLHSSEYTGPEQLADGPVLVVGASHSGGDIAFEAAGTHRTVLCGRNPGQVPFALESRQARMVFPLLWFVWNRVATTSTPMGRKMRPQVRSHGGPLLRVKNGDLAAAGVERHHARIVGAEHGRPKLDDGTVLDAGTVVWCTGFRQDFGWIRLPVIGEDGWPDERRGVVSAAPGLYFVGLSFQRSFASMLIGGTGTDAEYVAEHLHRRLVSVPSGSDASEHLRGARHG